VTTFLDWYHTQRAFAVAVRFLAKLPGATYTARAPSTAGSAISFFSLGVTASTPIGGWPSSSTGTAKRQCPVVERT
jgi:hypothetical protein